MYLTATCLACHFAWNTTPYDPLPTNYRENEELGMFKIKNVLQITEADSNRAANEFENWEQPTNLQTEIFLGLSVVWKWWMCKLIVYAAQYKKEIPKPQVLICPFNPILCWGGGLFHSFFYLSFKLWATFLGFLKCV